MEKRIRIGTRESQLALWQAHEVKRLLESSGYETELVPIKSEGDIDLVTPLYELGVQGIFTRSLDAALLGNRIDLAVHSMKDVPVQLAKGIVASAVLPRASYKDIFVPKGDTAFLENPHSAGIIATSSIRRKAQWLHRYPQHTIETLRGNVNTRLQKVKDSHWNGAIFAAAGLERIGLRPANAVDLDWMLPAPAQGAILVVCREEDDHCRTACAPLHHSLNDLCTRLERDFLKTLMGGCSTPISALAEYREHKIIFRGNILSVDGLQQVEIRREANIEDAEELGLLAAEELLQSGGQALIDQLRNGG